MNTGRPEAGAYYAGLYNDAQVELAALREELAKAEQDIEILVDADIEMQQRLAAAKQRNSEFALLLQHVIESAILIFDAHTPEDIESLEADILAALQPTESGASDKCISDGGTCGLGGQCNECLHKESGASE